jgi:ketosteroid isomerase-like protein
MPRVAERTPNVEAILAMWDAYGRDDLDGVLEVTDPEVEWREAVHLFDRGTYRGHAGIRQMRQENDEVWPGMRVEVEEAFDAGDGTVVAIGRFRDDERAVRFVHVCRLRDGKLVELTEYEDAGEVSEVLNSLGSGPAAGE